MKAIRALRALPLCIAVLALPGCISLGGGKPPERLFSLTAEASAPAGAVASGSMAEAIVVTEPEADRRLGVLRIPVQVDDANVAYLKDALWVERPARLFRGLLAETIRARGSETGGRLVFEGDPGDSDGRVRIGGRLVEMGYDARTSSVIVRFDAVRSEGAAMVTRRFESVIPGVAAKPETVGPALNRAANSVAAQVAEWVG